MRQLALAGALAGAACAHWDLGDRAPAHVEITTPPVHLAQRRPERGVDPGERWIALLPGSFVALALDSDNSHDEFGSNLGLEISARTGTSADTHRHPVEGRVHDPALAYGINLGLSYATNPVPRARATTLYAEAQLSKDAFGVAAGWSVDPGAGAHGPQATGFLGPFYLRGTHHLGRHTSASIGLLCKFELAWFWSR